MRPARCEMPASLAFYTSKRLCECFKTCLSRASRRRKVHNLNCLLILWQITYVIDDYLPGETSHFFQGIWVSDLGFDFYENEKYFMAKKLFFSWLEGLTAILVSFWDSRFYCEWKKLCSWKRRSSTITWKYYCLISDAKHLQQCAAFKNQYYRLGQDKVQASYFVSSFWEYGRWKKFYL